MQELINIGQLAGEFFEASDSFIAEQRMKQMQCTHIRPDSCSSCRTPEEDDRYWDERRREMDDENYEPNEIEYCND